MNTHHSYEDWGRANVPHLPEVLEAFSGTAIVRWYNAIKDKLRQMVDEQEGNRNFEYADLLRTYLNTWERNAITGSINRETLEILKAASEPLAAMKWNQRSYFAGLAGSLDELIADQEQLPTGVDTNANMGMAGGAGFSAPPMDNEFGPQEKPPGEEMGAEKPGEQGKPGQEPPGAPMNAKPPETTEIPIR